LEVLNLEFYMLNFEFSILNFECFLVIKKHGVRGNEEAEGRKVVLRKKLDNHPK